MSERIEKLYLDAEEAAEMMGVSKSHAYKIMRQMNRELKEMGFIVVAGKVNRKYFLEKIGYGETNPKERRNG